MRREEGGSWCCCCSKAVGMEWMAGVAVVSMQDDGWAGLGLED